MTMRCGICHEIPEKPVVSPLSGSVFEKRLITKYIEEYKKDPITHEPLEEEQLIEIKPNYEAVQPKLPSLTSIPSMLKQLRDEWDAEMLYSFKLKQDLMNTRQELSHAYYQLDASYRVISRLKSEVDELQKKLKEQSHTD